MILRKYSNANHVQEQKFGLNLRQGMEEREAATATERNVCEA